MASQRNDHPTNPSTGTARVPDGAMPLGRPSRRTASRALAALPLLAAGVARGQEAWPSRPIRLVVPAPAGGGTDNMARALADRMRELLPATIVVENRAGATTAIGNEHVAQSAADGYTLLFASPPGFTIVPHLRSVKYTLDQFEAVGAIGNVATMVVTRRDLPVTTLRDLVAHARKTPGKVTFGSAGVGSLGHLAGELFARQAGIEVLHVPFKGSADAVTAALGGHVDYIVNDAAIPHIKEGRLKGLAVFVDGAFPGLPQVPAIRATGIDVRVPGTPMGILAPKGVTRPILDRLTAAIEKASGELAFRERLAALSVAAQWQPPAEYLRLLVQGRDVFGALIREKGIKE